MVRSARAVGEEASGAGSLTTIPSARYTVSGARSANRMSDVDRAVADKRLAVALPNVVFSTDS